MRSKTRYRRILLLMITSQVLLTVFVLQWLRSQYQEEKERLSGDLTALYIDARNEMVDTLLFRNYVVPVLKPGIDSGRIQGDINGSVRWMGSPGQLTVSVEHKSDSTLLLPDTIMVRRTNDEMLLKSVKLIISHTRDSLNGDKTIVRNFQITPDTSAFKTHFHNRLSDAGLKFNLVWDTDSGDNLKRTLFLAPMNPFSLPGVSVENYTGYLTRKIFPQALFGLLLICLTALAFMLSYRSLRDHAVLNNLRNEFINNMTHELKTPVASISLAMESLSKFNLRNDPEIMNEYLMLALSETKRLESLVNMVLDHSMLEQNNQTLCIVNIDVNKLITEVALTMQARIKDKGIIEFNSSDFNLMVKCDPLLFKGVIMNLIDNSIKYSDPNPEIKIASSILENYAIITINDNGPGIPAEYHEKIFEKFFRIPSGNVHNVKGYGLGLSFASLVMRLHKGNICVRNLGKGCSFILKLPLSDAEN